MIIRYGVVWIYILIIFIAIASALYYQIQKTPLLSESYPQISSITINNVPIEVELAETPAQWEQGLSGRTELLPQTGMLFVFNKEDYWQIWMKDMNFPLDIIWLDVSGKIITIEKNVSPQTYPKTFTSKSPALYVIELAAGTADRDGFSVGNQVNFDTKNQ